MPQTRRAIAAMAAEIRVVSPERIAMEMRRILADASRATGVRLLCETRLAEAILPEIVPGDETAECRLDETLGRLARLPAEAGFPLALAAVMSPFVDAEGAMAVCDRWRLSNKETERIVWLVRHHAALLDAAAIRWSMLQPLLVAEGIEDLLALTEAGSSAGAAAAAHCRSLLAQPREALDPPPLLTGDDLRAEGLPPGPQYRTFLDRLRACAVGRDHWRQDRGAGVSKEMDGRRSLAAASTRRGGGSIPV